MTADHDIKRTLMKHMELCERLLSTLEQENKNLRGTENDPMAEGREARHRLIHDLDQSVATLRKGRHWWQQLTPTQRRGYPEVASLLRFSQDLTMKVIVLDRENEQALLRRGLVPVNHLPTSGQQRPHYVAELYRRNGVA